MLTYKILILPEVLKEKMLKVWQCHMFLLQTLLKVCVSYLNKKIYKVLVSEIYWISF